MRTRKKPGRKPTPTFKAICLGCGLKFNSEHRFNRVCKTCKGHQKYRYYE